ncbi:MAG: S24 family peptidase [Candidatus Saccharimonadales bacterium]
MDDTTNLAEGQGTTVAVHAGFPNPAAERQGTPLSLDRLLIQHPSSTYFFRIRGHHFADYGVFDGDIAIIDRAIDPIEKDLVVWWNLSGEFYLTSFKRSDHQNIWGVVTTTIHPSRKIELKDEAF